MGQYEALVGAAISAFGSEGGGGGGAVPMQQRSDVTTTTQIQVSPQISPVFTQQFQPSGSPVNAGATMAPTGVVPNTGYLPGFDYASGVWPTGTPGIPTQQAGFSLPPQAILAGLALAGLIAFTRAKRKGKR
jgi:hypothetical protein